ncbi:MAG: hypothetical protein ACRDJN_19980 [Chloroflexota bacterium]
MEPLEQLRLDFNRRDAHGRVRIGPLALARLDALREHRVHPGDRVLVVDADGNRCAGVLREDSTQPEGYRLAVELDWDTWVDGEALIDPDSRLPAAG